jgi:hypothetical protein
MVEVLVDDNVFNDDGVEVLTAAAYVAVLVPVPGDVPGDVSVAVAVTVGVPLGVTCADEDGVWLAVVLASVSPSSSGCSCLTFPPGAREWIGSFGMHVGEGLN